MSGLMHPIWDQLEQGAQHCTRHHDMLPGEGAIELSKAISLKRIADALAPAGHETVNHLLHQIALNGIPKQ